MKSLIFIHILIFFAITSFLSPTVCSPTLRIQAFGRNVPLGTLYDARTVSFIPGSSVFKFGSKLPRNAVETTQVLDSKLHIHVHPVDSTYSKFNEDDFPRAVVLSVLSEQLKVQGSWRYLVEEPKGQSLRYYTELRRKWERDFDVQIIRDQDVHTHLRGDSVPPPFNLAHLLSPSQPLLPWNSNATHFVVGILYGKSITAIFEDQSRIRKYGIAVTRDTSDTEEIRITSENGTHLGIHNIVRLYTDSPIHSDFPGAIRDTPEELEQHFMEFDNDGVGDEVPLLYDLIPLSSIVSLLDVNETLRTKLSTKWGPQHYIGDPYIEPLKMVPIYKEFDDVSIVRFRLEEAKDLLEDPEFEHLVQSRRRYFDKINTLQMRFEKSLENFKRGLREILTAYRYGRLYDVSFEDALEKTLRNYQRDAFSLENVTRILDTQFQGLQVAICLEKMERTVGNLYGRQVEHLRGLGTIAYE